MKSEPSDEPASVLVKEPAPAPPQPEGDAVAVKQEPAEELQSWLQDADAAAAPAAVAGKLQVEPDRSCWFFFTDAFEDDRSSPVQVRLFTGDGAGLGCIKDPPQQTPCQVPLSALLEGPPGLC